MEANVQFMSIADAVVPTGQSNKSFEEVRCDDYLQSYLTKGRAPEPVPLEPADDFARKALNMPPRFKPTVVPAGGGPAPAGNPLTAADTLPASLFAVAASGSTAGVEGGQGKPRITDPMGLPNAQVFAVTQAAAGTPASGEKYYTISAMPEFGFFSVEELRYYAYLVGNMRPPLGVEPHPFLSEKGPAAATVGTKVDGETLLNISARPGYEKHSPEEFRVAYMLFHREMASAELTALQNPAAAPVAPAPTLTTLTAPQPVPTSSLFGAPVSLAAAPAPPAAPTLSSAPSSGMFTFGFRPR